MLSISTILKHYKRKDVQEELILHARNKEVAIKFGEKGFGKRPDILKYPGDILELAKQGATSFHASEEIWSNPLQLDPLLRKKEIESLRIGWDLVIDIDCPYWPYSKLITDLTIKALKHHNIERISVKFSGNKGFHIGVPFEAFPKKIAGEDVSKRFPEDIREIALYLKGMIKDVFLKKILGLEKRDINKIANNLKKSVKEVIIGKKLDSAKMIDMDTILISSRHLYRMPYSLHEKSGLVSIPVDPDKIMEFEKEMAIPEKVIVNPKLRFLDREDVEPNQAKELFDRAVAERINRESKMEFQKKEVKGVDIPTEAVPERFFPPCINNILKGITDGKKRSLFILTNFLTSVGWDYDKIEKLLKEWNKRNSEPLREVLIVGQLRYHKQQKKRILPPNCQNSMYYKDFGICKPDNLCSKIKNPVNYSRRKTYFLTKTPESERKKNS
jgi:hypothetical protein